MRNVKLAGWAKGKNKLIVMIRAGAHHTEIYHRMKADGLKMRRVFSENPIFFPVKFEMIRSILFRNEALTDRQVSEVVAERMFYETISEQLDIRFKDSPSKEAAFIRKSIKKLSDDEISGLFDKLKEIRQGNFTKSQVEEQSTNLMNQFFEQKGIEIN